jgi:hypothetical protein
MPDTGRAAVSDQTPDLASDRTCLKWLDPGDSVTLPLETGQDVRRVRRAVNPGRAGRFRVRPVRLGAAHPRGAARRGFPDVRHTAL